jgi:GNAT superfamily N-acetyltransferase
MFLEVRPTTPSDAPALTEILQEAAAFKVARGDDMWTGKPFTEEEAAQIIDKGETFIGSVDGIHAVSFALQWSDERIWGAPTGLDDQAAYIHRLAVRERFRGKQIGERALAWAADYTAQNDRHYLRLDCSFLNAGLCDYYEQQGFAQVGKKELYNPYYAVAYYQKSVG